MFHARYPSLGEREELVHPREEDAIDEGVLLSIAIRRLLVLVCLSDHVHQASHQFVNHRPFKSDSIKHPLAPIEPFAYSFICLEHRQQPSNNGKPTPYSIRMTPDLFIEDAEELFLQSIGRGIVVFLVATKIGSNDLDEVVWKRGNGVLQKRRYGFRKLLERPVDGEGWGVSLLHIW